MLKAIKQAARSWKTTLAGVVAIFSGSAYLIEVLFEVLGPDVSTPALAVAAISAGFGQIFARDNDKTSEDVCKDD